jgi:nicotinate-nucleotide--dimethylbenzimidazole phosphoribosyltransferase
VVVIAAENGVWAEFVGLVGEAERLPTAVRLQNIAHGRAPLNRLAHQAGATLTLVDVGLRQPIPKHPNIRDLRVAQGTRNMLDGPALSLPEVQDALFVGMNIASQEIANGVDILALGTLGWGDDTAALAVAAALLRQPIATLMPLNPQDEYQVRQVRLIERALSLHKPEAGDVLDVLRCVGSLSLAAQAGVILAAAAGRVPLVLDGLVTAVAALVASELAFQVRPYLIAGNGTEQGGHTAVLRHLGLRPLLQLHLTLDEGTGSLLALHLVEAAARMLD